MKKKKDNSEIKFIPNPSAGIGFFNSTTAAGQSGGSMGEELQEKEKVNNKKVRKQIKEALNKIDNSCIDRRLPYYNLTGLYESANLSKKDEEDLGKVLFELKDKNVSEKDAERLHEMLKNKEDLNELFDIGLNLDASGQSVGILQGQGGEVKNEEMKLNELFDLDLNLDAGGQSVGILGGSGGSVTNNESLTEEAIDFDKEEIKADITNTVRESLKRKLGYDDDFLNDYVFIDTDYFTYDDGTGAIKVELRWEIGYEESLPVIEDLNKAIQKYDPEAYFEHETATDLVALIREDQSEDVVDEEVVSDYRDLIDSASTKEEVIDVYRRAGESREKGDITYATLFAISDYLEKVIDERFSDVAESLKEAIKADKNVRSTEPIEESLNESYYSIMTIGDIREGSIGNMSDEEIDLDERIFNAIGRYFHKNSNDVNVIVADGEEVLDPADYEDVFDSYSDNNLLGQRMKNYDIRVLHLDLSGKKYEVIREVRNGRTFLYFEDDYNANDFLDEMSAEVKRFYGESLNEKLNPFIFKDVDFNDLDNLYVVVASIINAKNGEYLRDIVFGSKDKYVPAQSSEFDGWEELGSLDVLDRKSALPTLVRYAVDRENAEKLKAQIEKKYATASNYDADVSVQSLGYTFGESLNESADEETPYTEEEVEADLKSITNNWTNRDGSVRSGFKDEQRHAVNVLRRHYNHVDTSYDDRPGVQLHYIVAYSSPMSIGKDSDGNIVRDTKESVNESMEDYTQTYEVTVDQIPDNEYPFLNFAIGEGYIKVFTDGGDFYDLKCLNRAECDRKVIHDLGVWAQDLGLKRFTANRYEKNMGGRIRNRLESLKEDSKDIYMRGKEYRSADDFYAITDLKELEDSLIGKKFDKDEVFGKLRETFNERAVSIMNQNMQIALGLSYLIEDQTGENVLDVDWEEKDGRIVLTHIDFIDDSEVVDDDNDTLDESKKLNESSLQLGEYVVKDGDIEIVAMYEWNKGNTYRVIVGEFKDSIQYGPLMFDKSYYTEEDAKRAFNRKVRELKRTYSD